MDINQEKNPMRIFGTIFFVVAIFVLAFSFTMFFKNFSFNSNSERIIATISNIAILKDSKGKEYKDTLVSYTINETEFNNISLNTFVPNYNKYDSIHVFVDKNNNSIARTSLKPYYLAMFLLFLGLLLLVSSYLAIRRLQLRKKEIYRLIEKDKFVYANIININNNKSLSIGGRNPLYIKCEFKDGEISRVFESDNIWQALNKESLDKPIKVYYDDSNMNTYYVDTRDLYV